MIAPCSPADCFATAIEATRLAVKYRTPVILLSDGYLANGSEPWLIPDVSSLPDLTQDFSFADPGDWRDADGGIHFKPFQRDARTLARPWAVPGTPGLEHRIGGIEKADVTGDISYDPDNHDLMVRLAPGQDRRDCRGYPAAGGRGPGRRGPRPGARLGLDLRLDRHCCPPRAAGRQAHRPRRTCATSTRSPATLGDVLRRYEKVLVPEINLGQLALLPARPLPGRRDLLQPGPGPAVRCRRTG